MSWQVLSDGRTVDRHGDAPISDADLWAVDFDKVGGYQPTIGGLRHLTDLQARPADYTPVRLLCGDTYEVGTRVSVPRYYDCHACAETVVERERCSC